tara:strand:+ start:28260 stop:28526 length:267 start_codon:yes stop_codon:yes gene_type:complete
MTDKTMEMKVGDLIGRTCIRECDDEQFLFCGMMPLKGEKIPRIILMRKLPGKVSPAIFVDWDSFGENYFISTDIPKVKVAYKTAKKNV